MKGSEGVEGVSPRKVAFWDLTHARRWGRLTPVMARGVVQASSITASVNNRIDCFQFVWERLKGFEPVL